MSLKLICALQVLYDIKYPVQSTSVAVGFVTTGSKMNYKCSGDMRKWRLHVTADCSRIKSFQIWQNMKTSWHTQWLISLSFMERLQSIPCSSGLTKALMILLEGAGAALDFILSKFSWNILSEPMKYFCSLTDSEMFPSPEVAAVTLTGHKKMSPQCTSPQCNFV